MLPSTSGRVVAVGAGRPFGATSGLEISRGNSVVRPGPEPVVVHGGCQLVVEDTTLAALASRRSHDGAGAPPLWPRRLRPGSLASPGGPESLAGSWVDRRRSSPAAEARRQPPVFPPSGARGPRRCPARRSAPSTAQRMPVWIRGLPAVIRRPAANPPPRFHDTDPSRHPESSSEIEQPPQG